MSTNIVCRDDRQRRLMRVLFRKAGVANRHTAVPHPIAYEWLRQERAGAGGRNAGTQGNGRAGDNGKSSARVTAGTGASLAVPEADCGGAGSPLPALARSPAQSATEPPAAEHLDSPLCWGPTTRERMQLYADHAAPLAGEAVTRALADAGLTPRDVTHLVTVSCTGFDAPGVDIELIDGLGLHRTTQRVNVGYMGCHGAINGLRVAKAIAASEPDALVLLSATELCSLHYRFNWDDEGIIGNALFADGSAAVLVGDAEHRDGDSVPDEPARGRFSIRATGSCVIPDSRDVMSWRIGDHGFEMRLAAEVAEKINAHLRPWLSEWLGRCGTSIESVGTWAVHPGGPRILSAVEEALSLPAAATRVSHQVLSELGNMSSPTVLFILDRLRRSRAQRPCVALGFGPGLVAEAALLE